jgi:farnesyl diphosphate synthase
VSALTETMAAVAGTVEAELDRLLPPPDGPAGRLALAMRYAALGGGKRLRPLLVAATAGLGRAEPAAVARVAAAIELVHAYSLVHDDLPAMDDAALRRGRPACHRAFGEAVAILAGDALLTLAFEALGRDDWPATPELRCRLVVGLGRAAGAGGMCGGQLLDLAGEGARPDVGRITQMQALKTGAMIGFACDAGALLGGLAPAARAAVAAWAADLGLAFQLKDDLLDLEGESARTGKDVRHDVGKATLVRALGLEGARGRLRELSGGASRHLDILGPKGSLLGELFCYVINRDA